MTKKLILLVVLVLASTALLAASATASFLVPQTALNAATLTKYLDPLPTFNGARVTASTYNVLMQEFQQGVMPSDFAYPAPFTGTWVWGYKVGGRPHLYPGFTVVAQRHVPNTVTYLNRLGNAKTPPLLQQYLTVDQTIHWANPLGLPMDDPLRRLPYVGPQPAVVHLHGGEVNSVFDGHPDAWWTPFAETGTSAKRLRGPAFQTNIYTYPNDQEAATLWFHDHTLGETRLNVIAGLAAFYFLRGEPESLVTPALPGGNQEIEIVIQDRQFDTNGQFLFPDGFPAGLNGPPTNPDIHPFWNPEFFGDAIVVNGKVWPSLSVQPRRYRLRFLNGSNARFYNISIPNVTIWVIGTDGGLLDRPVARRRLLIAPGERYDCIIDFAPVAGASLTMTNIARTPFPAGTFPPLDTTRQIMQFQVAPGAVADNSFNPAVDKVIRAGNQKIQRLPGAPGGPALVLPPNPGANVDNYRQLVLKEIMGPGGPIEVLLNNSKWNGLRPDGTPTPGFTQVGVNWLSELPRQGSTEVWDVINLTGDAHPIHLHLVQFQLVSRQNYRVTPYTTAYETSFPGGAFIPAYGPPNLYTTANVDGAVGGNPGVNSFLLGAPQPPKAYERGWKDMMVMYPGQVSRIVVRWAPQDRAVGTTVAGTNYYTFDPTTGPGYVWHCHILDHEDNEMMRPYAVTP